MAVVRNVEYNKNVYENNRDRDIRLGLIWTWQYSITVTTGSKRYLWLDTTGTTKRVTVDPLLFFATKGTVFANFYLGHDYSGGTTPGLIYNRNNNITASSDVILYVDPTDQGAGLGTLSQIIPIGIAATNQSSGGGTINTPDIIIVDNAVTYLLELDNQTGENVDVGILVTWKEEPV